MLQLHPPGLFRVRSGFLVIAMTLLTWSHTAQSGTPGGLSARPGDRKIELSWAYVDAPVTWNVKRSLSDSGPYSLISSLRTNAFSDTSVSNGIPYYYRITISWPDLGQNMALYHAVGLDTLSQWMQFGHKPHLSFTTPVIGSRKRGTSTGCPNFAILEGAKRWRAHRRAKATCHDSLSEYCCEHVHCCSKAPLCADHVRAVRRRFCWRGQ